MSSPTPTRRSERDGPAWWRGAVVYEVYVRSFADADGDGLGDLDGIRSRLGELVDLGIDAIWLTPFYVSPQADGGYDVADHRDVDPRFGTLAAFDALVAEAHRLGLRVIVDLVPNHTSSEHPWFRAAVAAGAGAPERARYVFRAGRGPGGAEPPNDWQSVFGGPAWEQVADGEWYLHLFAPEQPDLDWTNPEVQAEFDALLRFWLDRDVDGFRIDVAHGLAKDPALPDIGQRFAAGGLAEEGNPHWDQEGVHEVYRSWRRVLDDRDAADGRRRMFVAEAYLKAPQRLARYVRPDELHTTFNFNLLHAPFDAAVWREVIDASIAALDGTGAPPTWVLSTHDVPRHVTRYGGGALGLARARAATLLMLALPGVAYLYQGEELGLPDADLPDDARQDPTFRRTGGAEPGRDGCRVPLPWWGDGPSYGFGPGAASWLPQPPAWTELARAAQRGREGSTLELYVAALRLRREVVPEPEVPLAWIDAPPGVLAFRRGPRFACVASFTGEAWTPAGEWVELLASTRAPVPFCRWVGTGVGTARGVPGMGV